MYLIFSSLKVSRQSSVIVNLYHTYRLTSGSNGNSNSEYFEEVQRNVLALHRVLQSLLPPAQLQDVFFRIFSLLNRKIPQHFEEIMPSTPTGRQRIMVRNTYLTFFCFSSNFQEKCTFEYLYGSILSVCLSTLFIECCGTVGRGDSFGAGAVASEAVGCNLAADVGRVF